MVDNSSGLALFCVWFYKCEIECFHAAILRVISSFTLLAAQCLCSEQRETDTGVAQPHLCDAMLLLFYTGYTYCLASCFPSCTCMASKELSSSTVHSFSFFSIISHLPL